MPLGWLLACWLRHMQALLLLSMTCFRHNQQRSAEERNRPRTMLACLLQDYYETNMGRLKRDEIEKEVGASGRR